MKRISKCPGCGGLELYRSARTARANGLFGPTLLPGFPAAHLRVVVCTDCGLIQLVAGTVDRQALRAKPGWERLGDVHGPLGLQDDSQR